MRFSSVVAEPGRGLLWRIMSAPLFVKIMGIGVLVAAVFGSVTLLQIRGTISRALQQMQEQRARSMARTLAADLERPMSTRDLFTVHQKLNRTKKMFPDVRYVVVRDNHGKIVGHTFEKAVPGDLAKAPVATGDSDDDFRVFSSSEGRLFEVTSPVLEGHAGTVQLGMSDQMITRELSSITGSVLWSLALCATIGALLAILLTHILTRPVHHLVGVAKRVGEGHFDTRADVYYADEIGRLSLAFNRMTGALEQYREEVQERERIRQSLIEKIVHAQEEERKSISRELHDELGQSLLAMLLAFQSVCEEHLIPTTPRVAFEHRIRQLIEDVRRLAWGMRPSILDDYGLDSALARHVEEISVCSNIAIDYQYSASPGLGRLPREIEVTLYRIAQEAMTNVLRHARAEQVSAVVLQQKDEVTLLIEDDGCGFDPKTKTDDDDTSLGLTGMQERVALLGGTCAVESKTDQGTTIRVRIPLAEVSECLSAS
jgi:signal transduction histidine kinase